MQFLAGQYVDILLPDGKRRAFSIASPPQEEDELELHIRHVEGGNFTGWVFDELKEKDILRLEGPLGIFFIRHDEPSRPMILMGGGTGFAPLKSMIEDLLSLEDKRSIHLFWGAGTQQDLYQYSLAEQWAELHPNIQFTAALTDAKGSDSAYRGFVHEAVLDAFPDLSTFDVYMSGPPAMIEVAKSAFLQKGLPERGLYYDSFEYGLDVPVRILARPH